jgi:hypothetical protein
LRSTKPARSGSQQTPMNSSAKPLPTATKRLPAYLPLALVLIVLLIAALVENYIGNWDVREYQCYANAFWYGEKAVQTLPASPCQSMLQIAQFHSFPLEYPPMAMLVFSLPLLGPAGAYPGLFALWMGVMAALIYWLLLRYGPPNAARFFAISLLIGGLATGLARFDLVPAALILLCVIMAERRHWARAHIALALGVLMKGYPIVLFPILFLAEQRKEAGFLVPDLSLPLKMLPGVLLQLVRNIRHWRWKNTLLFSGLLVGISACFWGLSPTGAFSWLSHLYLRPFEVESIGSVLLWLASFLGIPAGWMNSFGSLNTISPIAGILSQFFVFLFGAGYVFIIVQQLRGKMGFFQASLAALLLLIATNKVFSPQYLLWLMPFMAMRAPGNRRLWRAWLVIAGLTTLIYPVYFAIITYTQLGAQTPGFMPLILIRDGLFVALTLAYMINFRDLRAEMFVDD